jgi:hypothetical protein
MPRANTPTIFSVTSHRRALRHARALGFAESVIQNAGLICECYQHAPARGLAEVHALLSNAQAAIEIIVNGKDEEAA